MVLVGALMAVVKRCRNSGPEKPFARFLCHHKAATGAFARLLKIELVASDAFKGRIFIDSDDLTDIDMLFEYVGHQSDKVLVLCSTDLIMRPWCMGELVTAVANRVPTLKVVLS